MERLVSILSRLFQMPVPTRVACLLREIKLFLTVLYTEVPLVTVQPSGAWLPAASPPWDVDHHWCIVCRLAPVPARAAPLAPGIHYLGCAVLPGCCRVTDL